MEGMLNTIISGVFSLAAALGSVWLKDYLERRRTEAADVSVDVTRPAKPERPATGRWSWYRPLVVFLGGFFVGVLSRWIRPMITGPVHYEALGALAVLVVVSLWLALDHRRYRRPFWPFGRIVRP